MYYLFQLVCTINQKTFIGVHQTEDPFFANPPLTLSNLQQQIKTQPIKGISLPSLSNSNLKKDIKQFGANCFVISTIGADATKEGIQYQYDRYVTDDFIKSEHTYNTMMSSPIMKEQRTEKFKTNNIIERDEKGRVKGIKKRL